MEAHTSLAKIGLMLALIGFKWQAQAFQISADCHPPVDPERTQYLIGYGSLINSDSKKGTYSETGPNIPVQISGFKRTWTAKGFSNSSLSTTFLGVDINPRSYLNGVIFRVPNSTAVQKYDARERSYCRVKVPFHKVTFLRGHVSDNGTFPSDNDLTSSDFWVYVTMSQFREFPDNQYPIVQSYVDVFLRGCLQMEHQYGLRNYSDECITTTDGWDHPWVNDRIHPRRAFAYQPYSWPIDKLISRHIPEYPKNTYIEGEHVGFNLGAHFVTAPGFQVFGFVVLVLFGFSV